MKIEDLKVGRVYRAKRPRVVHTLGGSYINDRQTIEKILKITKSGTIYLRSTNCKDAIRFRKNGQWLDNFGYQGGLISGYSLKNPYKNPFDFTRVKI